MGDNHLRILPVRCSTGESAVLRQIFFLVSADDADTNSDGELSEEELSALTIRQLKALAAELGYTITATTKAGIIAEILEQQAAEDDDSQEATT